MRYGERVRLLVAARVTSSEQTVEPCPRAPEVGRRLGLVELAVEFVLVRLRAGIQKASSSGTIFHATRSRSSKRTRTRATLASTSLTL